MRNRLMGLVWALVSVLGAVCLAALASSRHEPVNSLWLVAAAACIFLIGFRIYGKLSRPR